MALVLGMSMVTPAAAQSPALQALIEDALKTHPLVEQTALEYWAGSEKYFAANGINDWNLFLSASLKKGLGSQGFNSFSDDGQYHEFSTGGSRVFSATGTRLKVAAGYTALIDQPAFGGFESPNTYKPNISFTITQPLLKNAWGLMDRYPIQSAGIGQRLALIKYHEDLESLVEVLVGAYLDWQLAEVKTDIFEKQLQAATQQKDVTTRQFNRGAAEKSDLILAQQNEVSKRMQYLQEKVNLNHQILQIETIINRELSSLDVDPSSFLTQVNLPTRNLTSSLAHLVGSGNIIETFRLSAELQALNVSAKKNQREADLSVFLTNESGASNTTWDTSVNDVGANQSLTTGVALNIPLENNVAVSDYNTAVLNYDSLIISQNSTLSTLKGTITSQYYHLDSLELLLGQASELVKLAKQTAKIESTKHRQGRTASLYVVLDTQDKALSAQLQLEEIRFRKLHLENDLAVINDDYIPYIKTLLKEDYVR
ncbi:TolC family protein [bacterium]|nr:TolC family protein [bacterium]